MFVESVSGIDDAGIDITTQELRSTAGIMADYDDVDSHCFQISSRVDQRLAFADRTGGLREFDDIGAESIGRQRKTVPRPRTVLKEHIYDDLAAQRGGFFHRPRAELLKSLRRIKNGFNFLSA